MTMAASGRRAMAASERRRRVQMAMAASGRRACTRGAEKLREPCTGNLEEMATRCARETKRAEGVG